MKSDKNVSEVRVERVALERKVCELFREFELSTGVVISNLRLLRGQAPTAIPGYEPPSLFVEIRVEV